MTKPDLWHRVWQARWDILRYLCLSIFAVFTILIPFWAVFVNSVKPLAEASALELGLPSQLQLVENYSVVIEKGRLLQGLRNNLLIVIPATAGIVLLGAAASWVFARSKGQRTTLLYWISISGVLIPPAIVTSVMVQRAMGIHGTRIGVILFYIGVFISFSIFLTTGFVKTIPVELEEAARIDGASYFTTFTKIILPLLSPVLVTVGFISVLFIWNDFFYAFFLIRGSENHTLNLGLFNFVSGNLFQTRWNLVFASVVLNSLPLILLFMLAQRYVVAGLLGTTLDK